MARYPSVDPPNTVSVRGGPRGACIAQSSTALLASLHVNLGTVGDGCCPTSCSAALVAELDDTGEAGPAGHSGATLQSSASDPTPTASPSDKSLTGPAKSNATPAFEAAGSTSRPGHPDATEVVDGAHQMSEGSAEPVKPLQRQPVPLPPPRQGP